MYRPVSPHSDRGNAVKRSDLIAIEGGEGFVVLVKQGGYFDFKRFHHASPPDPLMFSLYTLAALGRRDTVPDVYDDSGKRRPRQRRARHRDGERRREARGVSDI